MQETADEELMRMIARGSKPAFEEVFRRHGGRVLGYCTRLVGDKATGEDVAQDVWIRVVKAAPDWQPQAGLRSWILTIARNASLNHLRGQSRLRAASEDDFDQIQSESDPNRDSMEDALAKAQDRKLVAAAMDRLPDLKRSALMMWLSEDMSYERIATELGISVANVKSVIFRAKKDLEAMIVELGGGRP